jgi:ribosome-associated heat shock protein Hsp15
VRIDQLLHWLCLAPSRSAAAQACRDGRVELNGRVVRPAHEVRAGDRILLGDPGQDRAMEVEVIVLPPGQVSRKEARTHCRVLPAGGERGAS